MVPNLPSVAPAWDLLVRRAPMMPRPATRSNRQICDGPRFRATPRGRLSSRFAGWSVYPSIAALTIDPEIDVTCHSYRRQALLDHLVGAGKKIGRHIKTEGSGGLEIDQ
jgi:hypothetical protein